MKRIAEKCRDIWFKRPIITTNASLDGRWTEGYLRGLVDGAVDLTITARRNTSNGKQLAGIRGGAA